MFITLFGNRCNVSPFLRKTNLLKTKFINNLKRFIDRFSTHFQHITASRIMYMCFVWIKVIYDTLYFLFYKTTFDRDLLVLCKIIEGTSLLLFVREPVLAKDVLSNLFFSLKSVINLCSWKSGGRYEFFELLKKDLRMDP